MGEPEALSFYSIQNPMQRRQPPGFWMGYRRGAETWSKIPPPGASFLSVGDPKILTRPPFFTVLSE